MFSGNRLRNMYSMLLVALSTLNLAGDNLFSGNWLRSIIFYPLGSFKHS